MKRPIFKLFLAFLVLAVSAQAAHGPKRRVRAEMAPDELIVTAAPGANGSDLQAFAKANGMKLIKKFGHRGLYHFKIMNQKAPRDLAALLAQRSDLIESAEPNLIRHLHYTALAFPNDPYYKDNPGSSHDDADVGPNEWQVALMQQDKAWNTDTGGMKTWSAGISSVLIADVDTGSNSNHDDLKNVTVAGFNSTTNTTGTNDNEGHGTHVASVICVQTNNSTGLCGGAYGCRNMPVKASDIGDFFLSDEISAIEWAADHGASVINMSFGGTNSSSNELAAINYALNKGVLLTASAGNGAEPTNAPDGEGEGNAPEYPANYPGVISVGATYTDDTWEYYSTHVNSLFCTGPDGIVACTNTDNVNYDNHNYGTSFAAPAVAALAGVLISNGDSTYACVSRIARTCDKVNPGAISYPYSTVAGKKLGTWSGHFGYGRINWYRAMSTLVAPVFNTASYGAGANNLNWTAPALDDSPSEPVSGYHVYRSAVSGSGYSLVYSASSATVTAYADGNAPANATAYYVIRAVNSNGLETRASNELSCLRLATPTPTFTPSPTGSPTPTVTPTFAYLPSSLGKTVLAPVPAAHGNPVCLYFQKAPARSSWCLYNAAGEQVSTLSFHSDARQCWDTSAAAPGIYFARILLDYEDGSHDSLMQKLVVTH